MYSVVTLDIDAVICFILEPSLVPSSHGRRETWLGYKAILSPTLVAIRTAL